jgi:hypothetical protein
VVRRLRWLIGTILVVAGLVVLAKPFRITLADDVSGAIRADCRAPLVAAWNTEEKGKLALWAVTKDGEHYSEVRGGEDPYCAERPRQRLALGTTAVVLGVAIAVIKRGAGPPRALPPTRPSRRLRPPQPWSGKKPNASRSRATRL